MYLLLLTYFIVGAVLLALLNKGDLVIYLNRMHTSVLNYFFRFWSMVGNGWFTVIAIAIVFPINRYKFYMLAANSALCGFLAQFFKRVFFSDFDRPIKILGTEGYDFIAGVDVASKHSFPSGHTTAAFALFIMMSLLYENKRASFLFVVAGVLVAFARMYLFEHFYMDTYAGAVLATFVTTVVYYLFMRSPKFQENI